MLSAIINKIRIKRKMKLIHHGQNTCVAPDVTIHYGNNIWIGDNSYINPGAVIIAGKDSKIQIGNNCLISYNAHLRTSAHNYLKKDILIREQGMYEKDIVIEDDCWVGFGAQIMAGVTMRKGSILAAGGVLTHDTEPFGVYAGVPARKIKERL